MTDDRLRLAIGRIERALSRIEVAVRADPASAGDKPDPAFTLLDRRHAILRSRTEAAIERIDRLLAVEGER